MASIKFPRKEFEKHIKLNKEIEEKISLFGTHLESLTSDEIELEILPNRPDLFSFQNFIRSFSAFIGKEKGLRKYKINPPEKNFRVKIDPSVKDVRPYTACAIVKNLSLDDQKIKTLIDLQEKIHTTLGRNRKKLAIGIYPLEKISLPITYEARSPEKIKFTPLEMSEPLTAQQILQKHPTGREYAKLLEKYQKFPVFVDSKGNILSMPPIINSNETGKITVSTKEIFIECSGFDFDILKRVLNIIVTTLADMDGKIYSMQLDYKDRKITPDLTPEQIKLKPENITNLLGIQLSEPQIKQLLEKMGYDYSNKTVFIPSWRTDIMHEVDIIEDIAIAYGYNNLIPEIPKVATIGEESNETRVNSKVSEILCNSGFIELSSYHLIKNTETSDLTDSEKIELENSKTDYKFLRPNLIIPMLRILSENKDNEYPQKIFEIGKVFSKNNKTETGIEENIHLLAAITPGNFTEIKRILDYLTKMLSLQYTLKESQNKYTIDGRTGQITINGKQIGIIGEMHPETLRSNNIKLPVAILQLNLSELYS